MFQPLQRSHQPKISKTWKRRPETNSFHHVAQSLSHLEYKTLSRSAKCSGRFDKFSLRFWSMVQLKDTKENQKRKFLFRGSVPFRQVAAPRWILSHLALTNQQTFRSGKSIMSGKHVQHDTTWYNMIQHDTTWYNMVQWCQWERLRMGPRNLKKWHMCLAMKMLTLLPHLAIFGTPCHAVSSWLYWWSTWPPKSQDCSAVNLAIRCKHTSGPPVARNSGEHLSVIWILMDSNVQLRHLWIPTSVRENWQQLPKPQMSCAELSMSDAWIEMGSGHQSDLTRISTLLGSLDHILVPPEQRVKGGKTRTQTNISSSSGCSFHSYFPLLSQFSRPSSGNRLQPFANCQRFSDAILASVAVSGTP